MSELMGELDIDEALYSRVEALEWINRAQGSAPLMRLNHQDVGLICAIAQPSRFIDLVKRCGVQVTREVVAGDHAPLDHRLKRQLWRDQRSSDAPQRWVTTLKDLVKLSPELDGRCELWGLRVKITSPLVYQATSQLTPITDAERFLRRE